MIVIISRRLAPSAMMGVVMNRRWRWPALANTNRFMGPTKIPNVMSRSMRNRGEKLRFLSCCCSDQVLLWRESVC